MTDQATTTDAVTLADVAERLELLTAAVDRLAEAKGAAIAPWLTVEQAAHYSGLSETSVRELLSAGKLIGRRPIRGRVLLARAELESLIAGATHRPRHGRGITKVVRQ